MISSKAAPALSAIVAVGAMRERAQLVIDRLATQTAASAMEIVIADAASDSYPRLIDPPSGIPVRYLKCTSGQSFGEVRATAAQAASAPLAAFIEDHSIPTPTWAENILRASEGDWVAAGYAFLNANPGTRWSWKSYLSWAGFIADYGEWAYPVPAGACRYPACNNVVYRTQVLLDQGDQLPRLLESDALLHLHLASQGKPMTILRDAVVAHQNPESFRMQLSGNFAHCRVIGAKRAANGRWGWPRRIAYGVAVPVVVPFMKFGWLLRTQVKRRSLWGTTIVSLPVAWAIFAWSSFGEGLGYIFGAGNSLQRFKHIEISQQRGTQMTADF
jgi:glycosyl transferase family 2